MLMCLSRSSTVDAVAASWSCCGWLSGEWVWCVCDGTEPVCSEPVVLWESVSAVMCLWWYRATVFRASRTVRERLCCDVFVMVQSQCVQSRSYCERATLLWCVCDGTEPVCSEPVVLWESNSAVMCLWRYRASVFRASHTVRERLYCSWLVTASWRGTSVKCVFIVRLSIDVSGTVEFTSISNNMRFIFILSLSL